MKALVHDVSLVKYVQHLLKVVYKDTDCGWVNEHQADGYKDYVFVTNKDLRGGNGLLTLKLLLRVSSTSL